MYFCESYARYSASFFIVAVVVAAAAREPHIGPYIIWGNEYRGISLCDHNHISLSPEKDEHQVHTTETEAVK